MDTNTGSIEKMKLDLSMKQMHELFGSKNGVPNMIPVKDEDMTQKQKEEMQVSKFDNRSVLGKRFTESRQVRRRKQRERIKKIRREAK